MIDGARQIGKSYPRYQRGNAGNFSEHRGTAGRYLNFSVGSTTDPENNPIVFKNILCYLKFTVPADMAGKITRIGVHTGAGDYLSGDQFVDLSGENPATSLRYGNVTPNNGSRYSTMYLFPDHGTGNNANITSGETFDAGSYYMAVMPCELKSGLFVTFETEDGTVCHKDHYAPSTVLLRNKVYDMGELTWNNRVAATGTGVSLPYAFSFLQVKSEDGVNVSFIVRNTGKRDACEVAQVYVGEVEPTVPRPAKELKGFSKVFIPKGTSRQMTVHLPSDAFAFYDIKTHDWKVNAGTFNIYVGSSVEDIRLHGTVAR